MPNVMPSYAFWNAKADKNVSCWQCEHFQRYDETDTPTWCEGECRKNPPQEARDVWDLIGVTGEDLNEGYCTWILFGNISWCNGFQRSLEANIPPAPPGGFGGCTHQDYTTALFPPGLHTSPLAPFSKKSILDSCWYCNHFQRTFETPIVQLQQCSGYCQIKPPERFFEQLAQPGPGRLENNFVYPFINFGPQMWCNRWERNPDAANIPDPPDAGTGPCNNMPPPP